MFLAFRIYAINCEIGNDKKDWWLRSMKNNIIISGVPRAGKSSISHRLSRIFGFQHVSMDSINAGFECCFPELGINTSATDMTNIENLINISAKIAPFIRAMLDSGEYDEFQPGMVLDVFQLLPEDYMKHLHGQNCEIHYFITSNVTPKERFTILKTHDTPNNYTFHKPDNELKKMCADLVDESKFIKEQCKKYNLPYYETARDRESMFDSFIQYIAEKRGILKK